MSKNASSAMKMLYLKNAKCRLMTECIALYQWPIPRASSIF